MRDNIVFAKTNDIPNKTWINLSQKNIYFGHKSVGSNIIDGIETIVKNNPLINLNIVEMPDRVNLKQPTFFHSEIGSNRDPISKIKTFSDVIQKNHGPGDIDIAFQKFCYVDFNVNTEITKVFHEYKIMMEKLTDKYPQTLFVCVTVPLKTTRFSTNFKIWFNIFKKAGLSYKLKLLKRIGNILNMNKEDNIARNEFNNLLRAEFSGKIPLFDLASYEATSSDGRKESFVKDGKTYLSLFPDYTNDGGHLNEKGRRFIAEQLLVFLANLTSE